MTLSKAQLGAILGAIALAETPLGAVVAALDGTFVALGAGSIHGPGPKIDGREYPLDDAQWRVICQALIDRGRELQENDVEQVNLALDWVNLGPSSMTAAA